MSLLLRRLLPPARSASPCWTIFSKRLSDVPIRKGPFWDICQAPFWGLGQGPFWGYASPFSGPGWPSLWGHPWTNVLSASDTQQEYVQRMEHLMASRASPWRRLDLNVGKESQSKPEPQIRDYGPNSEVIRTEMDKANLKMEMEFNVSQYHPEELFVYLAGDWVVITGRHGIRADKGYVTRQFMRQIYIPAGLNKDTICGRYTENGNVALAIKAVSEEAFTDVEKLYQANVSSKDTFSDRKFTED